MTSVIVIPYDTNINEVGLKIHAQNVVNAVAGNVNFTSPFPSLIFFQATVTDLDAAITN